MAKKKFYRPILYYLLISVKTLFSFLPYRLGFWFGGVAGKIAFHILPKERKKTLAHLSYALGGTKSESEFRKIGEMTFQNYGHMAAELVLIEKVIPRFDDFVSAEGLEILDRALGEKKGVIAVVSHFGNWEWMGGWLALKGYPGTGVARKIYYEKYDKLLMSLRKKMKIEAIDRDSSPRGVLKALKQNHIMAFAVDQDVETVDGVFVEFFGHPAFTPTAPVRFALSTQAPMVPMFMVRNGMRHRIFIEPPVELTETGHKEKDVLINTQKWVSIQEKWIRQYPEQWVWNHKRWKTRPVDFSQQV